jgi:hypothetical protein
MYTIDEKILKDILQRKFSALVGRSCKRIELIRDRVDIHPNTKFNLIRDEIKNLNYETMRDIEEVIAAFSEGVNITVNLEKPISK